MSPLERALRYAETVSPAVQGQEGSKPTFALACALINGFCLSPEEAMVVMRTYSARCVPPWSEKELAHKIATVTPPEKPRGYLLNGNYSKSLSAVKSAPVVRSELDPVSEIENYLKGFQCSENDLWDASPVFLSEDWRMDSCLFLEHLFLPWDGVNFVTDFSVVEKKDGTSKANPSGSGTTVPRDSLIGSWKSSGPPQSEAGGWIRINPVAGGVSDSNVTSFRIALLEFDHIPLNLQISLIAKLPLPIAAVLTSGSKSIHAWVKVDCLDFEDYQKTVLRLREFITPFGVDRSNKNPSRLSRLVGVTRIIGASGDGRQRLLYLSPNPKQKSIL